MYVTFTRDGDEKSKIMCCFYPDTKKQAELMHTSDITEQVKEWIEKGGRGNPPKFYSRINIERFVPDEEIFRMNIGYPK